jgi:hypothetical protein
MFITSTTNQVNNKHKNYQQDTLVQQLRVSFGGIFLLDMATDSSRPLTQKLQTLMLDLSRFVDKEY